MDIEQRLTEIIKVAVWNDLSRHTATKFTQALLSSPDITVVEKATLQKMKRVVEAAKHMVKIFSPRGGEPGEDQMVEMLIHNEMEDALKDLEVE